MERTNIIECFTETAYPLIIVLHKGAGAQRRVQGRRAWWLNRRDKASVQRAAAGRELGFGGLGLGLRGSWRA